MSDTDKIIEEFLEMRNECTGGKLPPNELLINAWEHACICVINGSSPGSSEFTMYAVGRRMILEKMKS